MVLHSTWFRALVLLAATAAVLGVGCLRDDGRTVTVTVTRTVTVPASPTPGAATAPASARIEGRFRMEGTRIETRNIVDDAEDDFRRIWTFRPGCRRGACNTTLRRQTRVSSVRVELEEAAGVYVGVTRQVEAGTCPDGSRVEPGYRTTARVEIRASETRRRSGELRATAIRSRLTITGRRVRGASCLPRETFQEYRYDGRLAE